MGLIPKAANFLGIDKFGQGLASAGRVISGHANQDIQTQQNADARRSETLVCGKE